MSSLGDLDARPQTYSRKEKSLGLLCVNFLNHYTQEQVDSISLDEAACRLGVERRRIYDIVNVLESVGVLVRKAKNRYTWKGYEGIPKALEKLREAALDGDDFKGMKGLTQVSEIKMHNAQVRLDSDDEEHSSNENCPPPENATRQAGKRAINKNSPVSVLSEVSKGSSPTKSKADCRREKSLGLLTQKFVQLFLVTQVKIVSLEDAARLLLGECNESAKLKTKVRRLYDIANILSSLNLIEKTHSAENRKPAFKWLGVKENAKYPSEMAARKRQFGTVLSTNTNTSTDTGTLCGLGLPKSKRGRPSINKTDLESSNLHPLRGGGAAKSSAALRPIQPRCANIGGAVYNPVPLYPREGSSMPMPIPVADVAASAPRVPTNLTLGTSGGGWREWTTTDSHRASSSEKNQKSGSGSVSESRSQCLDAPNLNRSGFPASNGASLSGGFSFGPFCPFRLQQQCLASISSSDHVNYQSDDSKDGECFSRENHPIVTPFPLHYQNEALDQMFVHYMNAWKSWCLQATTATATATSAAASPVTSAQEPCDTTSEDASKECI